MVNVKIKNLLFLALVMFQQITYAENQNAESVEFPAYTTEKYIYNRYVDKHIPFSLYTDLFGQDVDNDSVTDRTKTHYLNNGCTRIKTTKETRNGATVTTVEVWTSKNPSYITWKNGIAVTLVAAAATTIAVVVPFIARMEIALNNPRDPQHEYYKNYFVNWYDAADAAKESAKKSGRMHKSQLEGYAEGWWGSFRH